MGKWLCGLLITATLPSWAVSGVVTESFVARNASLLANDAATFHTLTDYTTTSSEIVFLASSATAGETLFEVALGFSGAFTDAWFSSTTTVFGVFSTADVDVGITDGTMTWSVLRDGANLEFNAASGSSSYAFSDVAEEADGYSEFSVHFGHNGQGLVARYRSLTGTTRHHVFGSESMFADASLLKLVVKRGSVLGDLTLQGVSCRSTVQNREKLGFSIATGTLGIHGIMGSVGTEFTATANVIVTQLGALDSGMGGFAGRKTKVAIYNSATEEIVAGPVTFSSDSPGTLNGASRFKRLGTPITLNAGSTYKVVAYGLLVYVEEVEAVISESAHAEIFPGNNWISRSRTDISFPSISVSSTSNVNNFVAATFSFVDGTLTDTVLDLAKNPTIPNFGQPRDTQQVSRVVGSYTSHTADSLQGAFYGILSEADMFGTALAVVPDLDGDGLNDIAVGAPGDDSGGTDKGAVYIIFPSPAGQVKSFVKISATSSYLLKLMPGDGFGSSLVWLGNSGVNSSSYLAVGAPSDNDGGEASGAVWVLKISSTGSVLTATKFSALTASLASHLEPGDRFGHALTACDVNLDGTIDLLVGAPGDDDGRTKNSGALYTLFLDKALGLSSVAKISNDQGNMGNPHMVNNEFGWSLSFVGDLDLDGYPDVAVAAPNKIISQKAAGVVYILFLEATGSVKSYQVISEVEGSFPSSLQHGDMFGSALCGLGDYDGDGIADLAVGSHGNDDGGWQRGAIYLVSLSRLGTVLSSTKVSSTTSSTIDDLLDNHNRFGRAIARIGDLDGDHNSELVVGVNLFSEADSIESGAIFVLFPFGKVFLDGCFAIEVHRFEEPAITVTSVQECYEYMASLQFKEFGITEDDNGSHGCVAFPESEAAVSAATGLSSRSLKTALAHCTSRCSDGNVCGSPNSEHAAVYRVFDNDMDGTVSLERGTTSKSEQLVSLNFQTSNEATTLRFDPSDVETYQTNQLEYILHASTVDNPASYGVTVSLDGKEGEYTISYPAGHIYSSTGVFNSLLTPHTITLDTRRPEVTLWTDRAGGLAWQVVTITVEFNEDVVNFGADDLWIRSLGGSDLGTSRTLTKVSGSLYEAQLDFSLSQANDIIIITVSDGSVEDGAGNPNFESNEIRYELMPGRCDLLQHIFTHTDCCRWERDGIEGGYHGQANGRFYGILGNSTFGELCTAADISVFDAIWADKGCSLTPAFHCSAQTADLIVGQTVELSTTQGLFYGELDHGDEFGHAMAAVGDLDGDGIVDIVVSAPGDDGIKEDVGALYVIFPHANGTTKSFEKLSPRLGTLDIESKVSLRIGTSLGYAGDHNEDGHPDIAVGIGTFSGIFLLSLNPHGLVDRTRFLQSDDMGLEPSSGFGWAVVTLGDLNGDGFFDLAIGAPMEGDGVVVLAMLGDKGALLTYTHITQGQSRFSGVLKAGARFGSSLAALRDVDSDGVVDIACLASGNTSTIWTLLLNTDGTVKETIELPELQAGHITSISGHIDFEGNGVSDMLAASNTTVSVILLNSDGQVAFEHARDVVVQTPWRDDILFGSSLIHMGDLDGDGRPEIAVAASLGDDTLGKVWTMQFHQGFVYLGCYSSSLANRQRYDYFEIRPELPRSSSSIDSAFECYERALEAGVDLFAISHSQPDAQGNSFPLCWVFFSTSPQSLYILGPGVASDVGEVASYHCNRTCSDNNPCGDTNYFTSIYAIPAEPQVRCTITGSRGHSDNLAVITLTVVFDEEVTGLDLTDLISPTTSLVSEWNELSRSLYTVNATLAESGTHSFSLPSGAAHGLTGRRTASCRFEYTFDIDIPTPTLSMNVGGNGTRLYNGSITVTVAFGEPVVRFLAGDLSVLTGSGHAPSVAPTLTLLGAGLTTCYNRDPETAEAYWLTETCASQFEIRVDFATSELFQMTVGAGVAWDLSGNLNLESSPLVYFYDAVDPTLESITALSGNNIVGMLYPIAAEYSGPGHEIELMVTSTDLLSDLSVVSFEIGGQGRVVSVTKRAIGQTSRISRGSTGQFLEDHELSWFEVSYTVTATDSGMVAYELLFTDAAGNSASETQASPMVTTSINVVNTSPIFTASLQTGNPDSITMSGHGDQISLVLDTNAIPSEAIYSVEPVEFQIGGVQRVPSVVSSTNLEGIPIQWTVTYTALPEDSGHLEFNVVICGVSDVCGEVTDTDLTSSIEIVSRIPLTLDFEDTDTNPFLISGTVLFTSPETELSIGSYEVYLGYANLTYSGAAIATVTTLGEAKYEAPLSQIQIGDRTHLLVVAVTGHNGLSPAPASLALSGGLTGPVGAPSALSFEDTDERQHTLSGIISWAGAVPATDVAWYQVYLSRSANTLVPEAAPIANVSSTLLSTNITDINVSNATHILVFSTDAADFRNPVPAALSISDLVGPPGVIPRVAFHDRSNTSAYIAGWLEFDAPSPDDTLVEYNIYVGESPTAKLGDRIAATIHTLGETTFYEFVNFTRTDFTRYLLVFPASVIAESTTAAFTHILHDSTLKISTDGEMELTGSSIAMGHQEL